MIIDKCDLKNIFTDSATRLPLSSDGNQSFTFISENIPVPPYRMETSKLYLEKGSHIYQDSYRIDKIYLYAQKETYRYLGLLILSAVFHPQPSTILVKLNHPASEITNLIIEYEHRNLEALASGYHTKPFAFEYYPSVTGKHPFDRCVSPQNLPCFSLTNIGNMLVNDDWGNRDTVGVFGRDIGMVLFAELLLNAALPQNNTDEYELEGENGFRGVGIGSAEVTLFLPGHICWVEENWS